MSTHKKIIVTGANGFVGRSVTRALVREGYEVTAIVRRNAYSTILPQGITVIEHDFMNASSLPVDAFKGAQCVIHLAGHPFHTLDFSLLLQANVLLTQRVLESCMRAGVQRLIMVSSISVYEPKQGHQYTESDTPAPKSLYGISKVMAEELCNYYHREHSIIPTILRFASIYGVGNTKGYLWDVLQSVITKQQMIIPDDGTGKRSTINVDDVVSIMLRIIDSEDHQGGVYNVSGPDVVTMNGLARMLSEDFHYSFRIDRNKSLQSADMLIDTTRVQSAFGWSPRVTFHEGIDSVIKSIAAQ